MYADLKLSTNTIINLIINDLNSKLKVWGNKNLRISLSKAKFAFSTSSMFGKKPNPDD